MTRQRLLLILFSFLVPGSVAFLRGRTLFGVVLLATGVLAGNFALLGLLGLWIAESASLIGSICLFLVIVAVLISTLWTWRVTSPAQCRRREARADRALALAYRNYLRDRPAEARVAIDGGLSVEPEDPELLHLRWRLIVEEKGHASPRAWRRLRRAPGADKWFAAIGRELDASDPTSEREPTAEEVTAGA